MTTRSAHFDEWARQFLAVNPEAVVLHLGCGLDSRYFRLDPDSGVEWYDVDYPDVATLRQQLYPEREHYHVVAASVTDPAWLADIPADRPTLMIAEGLTMYLTEEDGVALLRRIVEHAPSGELQFDAFNRLGIKSQWTNRVVRRSGATLHWGIDRPDDIVEAVPGVRLLAWVSAIESDDFARGALVLPRDAQPDEARSRRCATWRSTTATRSERARFPSTGCVPRPSRTRRTHGQRPRPSAHTSCSARTSGPPNATAQVHVRVGLATFDDLERDGPERTVILLTRRQDRRRSSGRGLPCSAGASPAAVTRRSSEARVARSRAARSV
mgnify:CR=1 FL=1